MTSGVRVDQLDGSLEDRHIRVWEAVQRKIGDGSMPPKGLPQPAGSERQTVVEWIRHALAATRSRPGPKNGLARRLTVPVLLVRGGSSELVSEDIAREFVAQLPDATYVDVHGAAHMVAGDTNDPFTREVVRFLDRIGP